MGDFVNIQILLYQCSIFGSCDFGRLLLVRQSFQPILFKFLKISTIFISENLSFCKDHNDFSLPSSTRVLACGKLRPFLVPRDLCASGRSINVAQQEVKSGMHTALTSGT